jgi:aminotransferase EvaB
MIPLNDLNRNYERHKVALDTAVLRVLGSGWWLNGDANRQFCTNFAERLGARHAIGVANGTDALELSLRALALHSETGADEVITVSNAGGYATTAIYAAGLVPVYCDIVAASQLVSIVSATSCLSDRTLAIVVTHLYGGLADVGAMRQSMDSAGFAHVAILEDCAQASGLGGETGMTGTLGDIATFSFYPTKNLGAMGDAGCVVTGNDTLAETVQRLKQYGWDGKYTIATPGGRNSRLDELQAAVLGVLLPFLDDDNARRIDIHTAYARALPSPARLVASPLGNVAHLAVVWVPDRSTARTHLTERGIGTDIHYPVPDHRQSGWLDRLFKVAPGGLPETEAAVSHILTIPCFPTMTASEVDQVVDALATLPRV